MDCFCNMSFFQLIKPYLRWRMVYMLTLGFASGFPLSLSGTTLQAWYTESGVSLVGVGALTLVGMPYTFKFLWAPLMDRFTFPILHRRRGWMLVTQLGLIISIAAMAAFDPSVSPITLSILALGVAFLSASQDITLDAYRTDVTDPEERGLASALWVFGWRIGALASGGGALISAQYVGWRFTFILMAALMFIGLVTTFVCETPKSDDWLPENLTRAIVDAAKEFLSRRYALWLLALIVLYKFGDAVALSLSTTFYLRGLGFSLAEVGTVTKLVAMIAIIAGTFVGGLCMLKLKLYRSLFYFGILQAVSTLVFVWLALAAKSVTLLGIAIFLEYFAGGMGTAAFLAFLMALCDHRYTATQFALLSAFMAVGRVLVGPAAGVVVEHIGWAWLFFYSFLLAIPGLALLVWLRPRLSFDSDTIRPYNKVKESASDTVLNN